MGDMRKAIVPKSDQLNADDLIAGEMTIKITGVTVKGEQEQPVSIHFEGDNGKPYKACKSMCRVMVTAWGPDSSKYTGRSMTLYRDPKVKWGGMEVGGIRISHMSHIDSAITMALTVTRANKKPFTVRPLVGEKETAAAQISGAATPGRDSPPAHESASVAAHITTDQALALDSLCTENGISVEALKKKAGVERVSMILAADYERAKAWVNAAIAKRKETKSAV